MRNVTFLYTKIQTLRKKQENLHYVFIYKNPDTLYYAIFHGIFEIGGGGVYFINKNNAHCVNILCAKKCTFRYIYIYKKPDTLRHIFIRKKNALCVTFLYLNLLYSIF